MKNEWYGDKRDIVKWSALLHLAETNRIKTIFQVVYLTPSHFGQVNADNTELDVNSHVLNHFRQIEDVRSLGDKLGITIHFCPKDMRVFTNQIRDNYHASVVSELKECKDRKIVFLDPDTGIVEDGIHAGQQHIKQKNVSTVWHNLNADDVLVLYQHKPLGVNGNINRYNWREVRRSHFADACKKPECVGEIFGLEIADDVTFFWAKK